MNEQRATYILSGDLHGRTSDEDRRREDTLHARRIVIGSHAECDLRLGEHFAISERHAGIEWDGEDFYLTDVDPAHVTLVNQREAAYNEPVALAGGDIVQIGPYVLELKHVADAALRIEVSRLLVTSRFRITRVEGDKATTVVEYESEVLLICNPPDQLATGSSDGKLILNKPKVSPLHAGISRFRDPLDQSSSRFYLIDLSPSNTTYLNGRLLRTDELAALSDGAVAQIGPFDLGFELEDEQTLRVSVKLSVDDSAARAASAAASATQEAGTEAGASAQAVADALRIFWAKRTREKAAAATHPSPLQTTAPERVGKARYKWQPTTDLARPWPYTLIVWCVVVAVGLFVLALAGRGLSAFSPAPISNAHARNAFSLTPAIAREPNANSCTTCHTRGQSVETNCASCHQTDAFTATVTEQHKAAGIGCTSCHAEHRGAEFRPGVAPFNASFQK
ncbi:MAG TPA: FHA domain-containing protein, partial [Pyrinomonadaceae bacterium]|nr:FHA domain-containing protein [Pyrinomonadaceae bacterium]